MNPLHLLTARLKGLINGVNPKWGTKTVIVSYDDGSIITIERRGSKEAHDDSIATPPDWCLSIPLNFALPFG